MPTASKEAAMPSTVFSQNPVKPANINSRLQNSAILPRNVHNIKSDMIKLNPRLETFRILPLTILNTMIKSPDDLARAGFYAEIMSDGVVKLHCCACSLRLDLNFSGKDAVKEHARLSPQCRFLAANYPGAVGIVDRAADPPHGSGRIADHPSGSGRISDPPYGSGRTTHPPHDSERIARNTRVEEQVLHEVDCLETDSGDSRKEIYASRRRDELLKNGRDLGKSNHMDKSHIPTLNKRVQPEDDYTDCIECEEEERQVLFLPCKHLICCERCGENMESCPICEETIAGTIRVYII